MSRPANAQRRTRDEPRLTLNPRKLRVLRPHERVSYPDVERPRTRGDCLEGGSNAVRPCPWVSCRYHLFLDVRANGSILINHPDQDVDDIEHSCALDIAESGGMTLEGVARIFRLSRERVRQICEAGFPQLATDEQLAIVFREIGEDACNRSQFKTNFR